MKRKKKNTRNSYKRKQNKYKISGLTLLRLNRNKEVQESGEKSFNNFIMKKKNKLKHFIKIYKSHPYYKLKETKLFMNKE